MPHKPLPEVPETYVVPPDCLAEKQEVWEDFFTEIIKTLGYDTPERQKHGDVSIEYYALSQANYPQPDSEFRVSNNRIITLVVNNRVVASVFEWRTEFNTVQVSAALYLTDETFEDVRFKLELVEEPTEQNPPIN